MLNSIRIVLLLWIMGIASAKTLSQIKDQMEEMIGKLAKSILSSYNNRCSNEVIDCDILSYNMCNGTGERQCFSNFPTPEGCLFDGIYLSNNSTVKFPDSISHSQLSEEQRTFICSSAAGMDAFEQEGQKNDNQWTFAFIGSSNGIFRLYPGFLGPTDPDTGECFKFQPRRRPWYVSAITGPKNTILLLDTSKTMKTFFNGVRLRNAMTTIQIIFETFNTFDHFAVVSFSQTAQILGGMKYIDEFSQGYKNRILKQFQSLDSGTGTNFKAAFEKAFQLLGTEEDQYTECPQIIILILTDGTIENDQTSQQLIQYIDEKMRTNLAQHTLRIISFVYGKAQNINYEIVKQITCKYDGIVFLMEDNLDQSQMVEKLSNYYTFLSDGLSNDNPVWSQPYEDTAGFGTVVSISKAVNYNDSNGIQKVLGVVGMDLLMSELTKYAQSQSQVTALLQDQMQCFFNDLTLQQLEVLRCQEMSTCNQQTDCSSLINDDRECSRVVSKKVFFDKDEAPYDDTFDELNCCGLSLIEFIALMASLGGFIIILTIVLVCLYRKGKLQKCCAKCKQCCCCLRKENESEEDGTDEIHQQSASESQSKQKMKLLEGTHLEDPQGLYQKALKDGKIMYDDDDQFEI